uniref:C2H2-type domain-containing protein n=1 Tax=Ursus maritimus TaxID=29073 RepID=A0A452U430_URSMA
LQFGPVIEGHQFWGSQQAVKSGDAECHFQVGPREGQCSSEPSREGEDGSFGPDRSIALMSPHRRDAQAPLAGVHSSREPPQREGIPSPGTLGLPGSQEASSWQGTPHPCAVCGESFWKKDHLEKHQRSHLKHQPWRSWEKFSKQAEAQQQRSIPQGARRFGCHDCGRSFHLKRYLLRHVAAHAGKSPPQCPECKTCSPHRQTLLGHRLRHKGERPPCCPQCDRSFPMLRAHRLRHSGERPFSCSECGRGFTHQCKLREHLRVHSGERPFRCPECDKSFRLKGILKAHQRTHSKERPFSCGECGKGFTRQSKLTEHFRVHSGERPFQCPTCDRSFRLKGQLLSHQRLHTGERPFQCPENWRQAV